MENKQNKGGGLNKSLKLIFVYTVATGSIFTFVVIFRVNCKYGNLGTLTKP